MATTLATPNTLLGTLRPERGAARTLTTLAVVVLGALVLTASAKISVPVWPVPVTLQTLAVAVLAAAFGWRVGVATVALYIAQGLAGLPVFATGGGPAYVFAPSFGFIVGWLPMAYIVGRAADLGVSNKPLPLFGVMVLGNAVGFLCGFLWLMVVAAMIVGSGAELPGWLAADDLVGTAFRGAVQPFVAWDILKMALAALTVTGAWALVKRLRRG